MKDSVKRYFDGLCNGDAADFAVAPNEYINCENFRFGPNGAGKYGRLEAIESHNLRRNKYFNDLGIIKAEPDEYVCFSDEVLTIDRYSGVLVNDVGAPPLAVLAGTFTTANGTLVLASDGSFVYTPTASFFGIDTFNYTLVDANGNTATGLITINVLEMAPGIIVMFHGTTPPAGFAFCDGSNGTPDLRGMFIVGYSPIDSDYNAIGSVGGSKTVALSINEMPTHGHRIREADHTGGTSDKLSSSADTGIAGDMPVGSFIGSSTITSQWVEATGGGLPHENRPPFYALAYIIKL